MKSKDLPDGTMLKAWVELSEALHDFVDELLKVVNGYLERLY